MVLVGEIMEVGMKSILQVSNEQLGAMILANIMNEHKRKGGK